MDLGLLGSFSFDWTFVSGFLKIIFINLILSGDNAVLIAMAVRSLAPRQRRNGIIFGAAAAVLLRVILTFFVATLLQINFIKLVGGAVILWIAVKLFVKELPETAADMEAKGVWHAVKIIVIADVTMATDNMLAVGGASNGNFLLLLLGLASSIPFIVFTSNLLSMLMDKYPVIIYGGAAILGMVGGDMIVTDPFIEHLVGKSAVLHYGAQAFAAAAVVVGGKLWIRRMMEAQELESGSG